MSRMPGANWLGEHSPRTPMERYDIVCVHTIVGYAPAHAAHFSTHDDGRIDQSRDTAYRSAANLNGNHRVIAIENEDGAKDVPLTDAQVDACARILAWAHTEHGVPLQLCPDSKPGSRGLAYHRQGIDGNFDSYDFPGRVAGGEVWSESFGKVCPRDKRIAQLPAILARAKQIVNGDDDMPTPDEIAKAVWNLQIGAKENRRAARTLLLQSANASNAVRAALADLPDKIADALPEGGSGITRAEVRNAAANAVRDVLGSLNDPKES